MSTADRARKGITTSQYLIESRDLVEGAGQICRNDVFHWEMRRKVESNSGMRDGCGLL